MKFTIKRETFLPALELVCGPIRQKMPIPILNNVLLIIQEDAITLTSSDIEMEIVCTIKQDFKETGESTVPGKKLLNICRELPEGVNINFNLDEDKLIITSGRSRFTLMILPAKDFPLKDSSNESKKMHFDRNNFRRLLEDTIPSIPQNDSRPHLNGLLFEVADAGDGIRAVATDGHRLSLKELYQHEAQKSDFSEVQSIIIPKKAVMELKRLLTDSSDDKTIIIEVNPTQLRLIKNNLQFTSKLIDGKFPDYKNVIPEKREFPLKANKKILQQVLIRSSILSSNKKHKGVRFILENNLLKAFSYNSEQGQSEEEMDVEYNGEKVEICFNVSYLLDALATLRTEDVILHVLNSSSSCLILPNSEAQFKHVVMPMKL